MMSMKGSRSIALLAAAAVLSLSAPAGAAVFTLVNVDPPGVGFNDNTAATPVGGNTGTTLGQQRLNVFTRAFAFWGDRMEQVNGQGQNFEIRVEATFAPITDGGGNPLCNQFGGVLGAAGADAFFANFGGGQNNVWYHSVVADHVSQGDIDPGFPDISATFNSDVDEEFCLGSRGWYNGFDGNAGNDIDLLSVVIHEVGHGMGFSTVVDLASGAKPSGRDDIYMQNLENAATGESYPQMSNGERVTASTSIDDLQWTGANVTSFVADRTALVFGDFLVAGFDPGTNQIEMYAPFPQEPGSSVSHYSTAVSPNEIMEPSLTQPIHNLALTVALMEDIGWTGTIQCGDADRNGTRAATDALIALQTGVGAGTCLPSLCDPSGDGNVTATDALIMLQGGTGQDVVYDCGLTGS